MSGDPTNGGDDRPQGRIFVPEGPIWDAWVAPGGGAVRLSAQAMKMEARWLRRARPRPFGFAPGGGHPVPERLGEAHGSGTLSSGVATILGLRTAVHTMSVHYGDPADPLASAAEIISDFHEDYQDRELEQELRDAPSEWAGQAEAPDTFEESQVADSQAEVTSATINVVVAGRPRQVSMLRLGEFSAFQFRDEGVLVTVLARHLGSPVPDIVRLTDLEPMLAALEHPDKEVIAAALAELRRQHIEEMRNQNPDS